MEIHKIPYSFRGIITHQKYNEIERRIKKFDNYSLIGKDASNMYDMYMIQLGNVSKPAIMVIASLHGTEWQTTQYTLNMMEQLRDNTFPDKKFRKRLLSKFQIIYIPVGNPWGFERAEKFSRTRGRNNYNKINLNRDFYEFSQAESKNIKAVIDKYKPFAYLDCHMMAPRKDGGQNYKDIIVGNVDEATNNARDSIAKSLSVYSTLEVETWDQYKNQHLGLSRRYVDSLNNLHIDKTLSLILEMYRPVKNKGKVKRYLSDQQINNFGVAALYLFFLTSIKYYKKSNGNILSIFVKKGRMTY